MTVANTFGTRLDAAPRALTAGPAGAVLSPSITRRADALFADRLDQLYRRTDRMFAVLMAVQWGAGIACALLLSPYAWAGRVHTIHAHVVAAVVVGGALSGLPIALAVWMPGHAVTRYVIACAQMLWSALLIHLSGGRIETHFHVFGSLAFLAAYREWKLFVPATIIVAGDHLLRGVLWPESVYGVTNPEWWRFLEHAGWVIFCDVFLTITAIQSRRELRDQCVQQVSLADAREASMRAESELAVAASLQTSLLPRSLAAPGLEIGARMLPATEVGGDYYDVLAGADGQSWIAIGDVAGHGLPAGIVMLMVRTAVAAAVERDPSAKPADIVCRLNRLVCDAIRERMRGNEHVTFSLMRHTGGGHFVYSGAHEDILIWRRAQKRVERVAPHGTWLGVTEDIRDVTHDSELQLDEGDVMVLLTDGLFEGERRDGSILGVASIADALSRCPDIESASSDTVVQHLLDFARAEAPAQHDDITLVVVRRPKAA